MIGRERLVRLDAEGLTILAWQPILKGLVDAGGGDGHEHRQAMRSMAKGDTQAALDVHGTFHQTGRRQRSHENARGPLRIALRGDALQTRYRSSMHHWRRACRCAP